MDCGRTETTVREFDDRGRLLSETVTTVERRRVLDTPPGFAPPAVATIPATATAQLEEAGPWRR